MDVNIKYFWSTSASVSEFPAAVSVKIVSICS